MRIFVISTRVKRVKPPSYQYFYVSDKNTNADSHVSFQRIFTRKPFYEYDSKTYCCLTHHNP